MLRMRGGDRGRREDGSGGMWVVERDEKWDVLPERHFVELQLLNRTRRRSCFGSWSILQFPVSVARAWSAGLVRVCGYGR